MNEPDSMFWDRLQDMPAWEAEQECVMRREDLIRENAALCERRTQVGPAKNQGDKELGDLVQANNAQLAKLVERIKYLRKLSDRVHWRDAVRALYGDDAVSDCVVYMEQRWAEVYDTRRGWSKSAA